MTTVRATVAPEAIDKVTRLFNGTIDDIANELLQNARRADASCVTITIHEPETHQTFVTISDDGKGIAAPHELLSLGKSQWDAQTALREDPAGMGFFSLAGLDVTVVTTAFSLTIPRDAWTGTKDIEVQRGSAEKGTAITFPTPIISVETITRRIAEALKFYPLPATINGEAVKQADFLDGAYRTFETAGLRIGVYKTMPPSNVPNLNFHGLTLRHKLPTLSEIHNAQWFTKIDIVDAPQLVLVLPARKELVHNNGEHELQQHCLRAMFDVIAAEPLHRLAYKDWMIANTFVDLAQPPAWLSRWHPSPAHQDYREYPSPEHVPPEAIICETQESSEDITLAHAFSNAEAEFHVFSPEPNFAGYAWYDAIPKYAVSDYRCLDAAGQPVETDTVSLRPETITVVLASASQPPIDLATDVAIFDEIYYDADEISLAVTASAKITANDLSHLLYEATFCPSDDSDADSWESQSSRYAHDCQVRAVDLLSGHDAAIEADIELAFNEKIAWRVPKGKSVTISCADYRTTVVITDAAGATA